MLSDDAVLSRVGTALKFVHKNGVVVVEDSGQWTVKKWRDVCSE
jgi:hypothetical protein